MGNVSTPPTTDFRTERVIRNFHIPMEKVQELWVVFRKHALSSGELYMTKDEFFNNLIKLKETCISEQLFKFIGTETDDFLSFGEFVELVTTFACFEKKELIRYLFYILDPNRTGLVAKTELKHFVHNMWENRAFKNITDGLDYLDGIDDGDGAFNVKQLESMVARYPMMMAPLYKLQVGIIQNTLGEYWWEKHKAQLSDARLEAEMQLHHQLRLKEKEREVEKEIISDGMVRQRMGKLRYYLFPWRRDMEKARLLRLVAIEHSLDGHYKKFTREVLV